MPVFQSVEAIKELYNIENEVSLGDSSYVKFIKHQIVVSKEGVPAYIQIGELSYGEYQIETKVAKQADSLLEILEKRLDEESELESIELVVMGPASYRLHATTDKDSVSIDDIVLEQLAITPTGFCVHCHQAGELVYSQAVSDSRCQICGEWQQGD